jgi:hypothetical protein
VIKRDDGKILKYKDLTVGVEHTKCVCLNCQYRAQSETTESPENRF